MEIKVIPWSAFVLGVLSVPGETCRFVLGFLNLKLVLTTPGCHGSQ